MKKIIITTAALCMVASALTGCGRKTNNTPETTTPSTSMSSEVSSETSDTGVLARGLEDIGNAIEKIGEWPLMVVVDAEDEFFDVTGLEMKNENYKQVYMRRANLEGGFGEYIIIEANDVDEAVKDLEARKERLIAMDTPYDNHTELAKGAIVGKSGNYAYLIARENPEEVEAELLNNLK